MILTHGMHIRANSFDDLGRMIHYGIGVSMFRQGHWRPVMPPLQHRWNPMLRLSSALSLRIGLPIKLHETYCITMSGPLRDQDGQLFCCPLSTSRHLLHT